MSGEPNAPDVAERFNGAYPTAYNSGAYKADEAFARGAVGVITLSMVPATDAGWLRGAQFGNRPLVITHDHGDLLRGLCKD